MGLKGSAHAQGSRQLGIRLCVILSQELKMKTRKGRVGSLVVSPQPQHLGGRGKKIIPNWKSAVHSKNLINNINNPGLEYVSECVPTMQAALVLPLAPHRMLCEHLNS